MSQIHTLYFIHHSHTDIGYTHDQPIVFDMHRRFLDEALDFANDSADRDTDGAFRWTVETTYVLARWLEHATPLQIERFKALERAGRIEVTGMFANITPLYDADQLVESFQLLRPLRDDFGFTIQSAMNCDVNGENWPLVDLLLDLGIEGFTMAINTHFGGAPFDRPNVFWWQGPSERKILAYNGWPYDQGWRFGIGRSAEDFEQVWWPRVARRLEETHYPLDVLMVQSYHPFGDNGSAYKEFSGFIDAWNAQGKTPRLVFATPKQWWAAVRAQSDALPTFRGDWTDYWNFGCISSAREQTVNRASRARLRAADALAAAVLGRPELSAASRAARSFALYRDPAWHALHLFDEHTWGADVSVREPCSEDTAAQWNHKASYAYTARSLSLLLQRDALAELTQQVEHADAHDVLVFNPAPWARVIAGQVSHNVLNPRGVPEDVTAGRHFQDRASNTFAERAVHAMLHPQENANDASHGWLKPVEVTGFGYRVVSRADVAESDAEQDFRQNTEIENARFRLTFDGARGGIVSLFDKQLERELVDRTAGYPLNAFVHEKVAEDVHPWPRQRLFHMEWKSDQVERARGWKPGWQATRTTPSRVLAHRVYSTPLGTYVVQLLDAPGCVGPLKQSIFLPNFAEYIECESWWDMGLDTHPEATYLVYPFAVPGATARLDLGGQAIAAGHDQLPGVCRDYFTVQQWVDFSNDEFGVTIAMPDNPMVQLGGFHFADNQSEFSLERAMLLGWVTNNYWETNFRAHQPGEVCARYRILPHPGGFDEMQAHRFGTEAVYAEPLVQQLGETQADSVLLPEAGTLLRLPESLAPDSPILTLHIKPALASSADSHRVIVRLLNASDREQRAEIGSGLLRILGAMTCDLLEKPLRSMDVHDGAVSVELAPRQVMNLQLDVGFVE